MPPTPSHGDSAFQLGLDEHTRSSPDAAGTSSGRGPESVTLESASVAPLSDEFVAPPIPGYTFHSEIHRGGQGIVYTAIQHSTKRRVAIKIMRSGALADRDDRFRFEREVEVLARLNHPNIVTIHDSGVVAGCAYFVMDYISGEPLDAWVRRRQPSILEIVALFHKICAAVDIAHRSGVVHRDLKPGNIRIDPDDAPHILDFGLAKFTGAELASDDTRLVTVTGRFMGSLPWASPEQAEAAPSKIDARTDVYAVGVMLYQMLTDRFPYEVTGNMRDVLNNIIEAAPLSPRRLRRGIDRDLETIVLKCLHKDRHRRYFTAGELARDLAHYVAGEPIEARRDSLSYVLRTRGLGVVRRHARFTALLVALLSAAVAHWGGVAVLYHVSGIGYEIDHAIMSMVPTPAVTELRNARILLITDETELDKVAELAELDSAQATAEPRQLRAVHGRFMQKLAAAAPSVVVWCINFKGASPHDEEFLAGVDAIRQAGGHVVIAADTWSVEPGQFPQLSPRILAATHWGCAPAWLGDGQPWQIPLAVQRGMGDPLPSLAVQALARHRHPDAHVDLRLQPRLQRLTLRYWRPAEHVPDTKVFLTTPDTLEVTRIITATESHAQFGIAKGDQIARWVVSLPPDKVLEQATWDYGRALAADDESLRAWAAGRVVVIGDQRRGRGAQTAPDGRVVWDTYGHAVAIDGLLRELQADAGRWLSTSAVSVSLSGAAALCGMVIGCGRAGRTGGRMVALLGAAVFWMALSVASAWQMRILYNPLLAIAALVLAGELAAWAQRTRQMRPV